MESQSKIWFTSSHATQTDHKNVFTSSNGTVTIPLEFFHELATPHYSKSFRFTTVGTSTDQIESKDAFCQTDRIIISYPTDNVSNHIETATTSSGDTNLADIIEISNVNSVVDAAAVDPNPATSLRQSSKNMTTSLTPSESLISTKLVSEKIPYGQLPKIPIKVYQDRRQEAAKKQTESPSKKCPILSSYLTDNSKSIIKTDHTMNSHHSSSDDPSKMSMKRKPSSDHRYEKSVKQTKVNDTREVFRNLARTIEALGDVDSEADSISGQDDLETWCLTKALRSMEKYKSQTIQKHNAILKK